MVGGKFGNCSEKNRINLNMPLFQGVNSEPIIIADQINKSFSKGEEKILFSGS